MGEVHYKFGYVTPSVFSFMKAFDFSTVPEDQFKSACKVCISCYEVQNFAALAKFLQEVQIKDQNSSESLTNLMTVLPALSSLIMGNFKKAV